MSQRCLKCKHVKTEHYESKGYCMVEFAEAHGRVRCPCGLFVAGDDDKTIILAVDAVMRNHYDEIALIKRAYPPYAGYWALIGGKVEGGETTQEAIAREVKEETGLDVVIGELIGVYSKPDRDPRGRVVSIAYSVYPKDSESMVPSHEGHIRWWPQHDMPTKLAFDHRQILSEYRETP